MTALDGSKLALLGSSHQQACWLGVLERNSKSSLQGCCLEAPDSTVTGLPDWQVAFAVQLPDHERGTSTDLNHVLHLPSAS